MSFENCSFNMKKNFLKGLLAVRLAVVPGHFISARYKKRSFTIRIWKMRVCILLRGAAYAEQYNDPSCVFWALQPVLQPVSLCCGGSTFHMATLHSIKWILDLGNILHCSNVQTNWTSKWYFTLLQVVANYLYNWT